MESLLFDTGRVTGIQAADGRRVRARLTIGADGKHSRVARAVAAPIYEVVPTLACWYFTYFSDVPDIDFEMHLPRAGRALFAHRTHDDLLAVFVGFPIDEFGMVRQDIERSFLATVDSAPGLGDRVRAGRRVERFYGTPDLPNFLRRPFGPGWALVGDAGCHKDPFLALGVCDALRDAELLADAADAGLSDLEPLEQALASYQQCRDQATLPDYHENLHMAQLGPLPADALRLRLALRDHPADTTQFVLARYGRIPHATFFNPANVERLLNAADFAQI